MAPHPAAALYCLGFPPERLGQLAAASGLPLWHPGDGAIRTRVVLLLGHAWEDQVTAYLTPPYSAWIEVAALADQPILDLVQRATDTDLYASFTTITANRLDLAGEILLAITAQRPLSETCRDNIELALHEALCNALLHGNLQMEGIGDLSVEALERFSTNLVRRISDPELANRRVDVVCGFCDDALTIDVVDQGCGFEPKPMGEPKASGRGFELIGASCQSFRLLEGGRRVSMRFPL
ncbi:MAG: ATP-binding protein [Rhodospirillaceae bacterium]